MGISTFDEATRPGGTGFVGNLVCKYQCRKCSRFFQSERPRMVSCPYCGHGYVKWLNYQDIVDHLMRNDAEYITSYNQVTREEALRILEGLKSAIEHSTKPLEQVRREIRERHNRY